ncbi:MAG: L-seryl-tRNA(Sec) selenium transferase, partial [Chloroflexi bacterium]
LETYRDGEAEKELPVWRMIAAPARTLAARARALVASLSAAGIAAEVLEVRSTVGGGSLPEETQPSFAVAIGGGA